VKVELDVRNVDDAELREVCIWENEWRWPSGWRDVAPADVNAPPRAAVPPWSDARGECAAGRRRWWRPWGTS
jgi:hypothetical protein